MNYINKAEITGRVGSVRIQDTPSGKTARIAVVTEEAFKNRDGATIIESTWHCIVAWNRDGIVDLDLLSNGKNVHATGKMRSRRYMNADGHETGYTEIVADKLEIVS